MYCISRFISVVEVLCYKPEVCGGLIPSEVIGFSVGLINPTTLWT
jgi:hypothetical protein